MKERRYVKFKIDIYDDTKTKIIDQRPERDFIHYFFARSIILAGKSDCEGELYMAKDIPYTIETLAVEFGRDKALIKLALDVLIELKMIEVTEDNIYKVKSFAKHQNIKVKEEVKVKSKEEPNSSENNKEITCNNVRNTDIANASSESNGSKNHISDSNSQDNIKSNSEQSNLINLEMKENNKPPKKKTESILVTELVADQTEEEPPLFFFTDGDMAPLGEGERLVWGLSL